jgi:hypothetical protein
MDCRISKFSSLVTKFSSIAFVASVLTGLFSLYAVSAPPEATNTPGTPTSAEPEAGRSSSQEVPKQQSTEAEREIWRKKMLKTPRPKGGCFRAIYPQTEWQEVPCATPPHKIFPPRSDRISPTVGGGGASDFSARVTSGHIIDAEGYFPSVNVTSPAGEQYSLQLNTNPFTTQTCNGSPDPAGCQGWEQFVYESSSGEGYIQYWLLRYGPLGTACPAPRGKTCVNGEAFSDGWCPFVFSGGTEVFCVVNADSAARQPSEPLASLDQLRLNGAVAGLAGQANDSVTVSVSGNPVTAPGNNYFPDLGSGWTDAEFNVFGDGGGDQVVFNSGSTILVKTEPDNGTTNAPSCPAESFTGESNNLTLVTPCCPISGAAVGASPAILFTESNASPAPKSVCTCPPGATWNVNIGSCSCDNPGEIVVNGACVNATCPPGDGWVLNQNGFTCVPIPKCPTSCPHCIVDNAMPGLPKFICLGGR